MVDVPFEVSNRVEVFNVVDGGKQWEAFLDDAPTQVFIQGDAVYASTRKSVWALDLARGTARWRFDIASGAWVDHPEPASVEKLYDTTAAIKRMTSSGGQADPGMAMPDIAPSPDGSKIALLSWPGSITVLDAAARRSSTFDVPPADRAGANQTWSTVHWFDGGPIVCFGQQFIAYDSGFKERFRFKDTSGPLMTLVVLEEEKRILANVARQFYLLGRNGEVIAKTGYDDRMFFVGRIGGDYLFIHQAGHLRR
jgi:outer membrane protein assembly factor BamB